MTPDLPHKIKRKRRPLCRKEGVFLLRTWRELEVFIECAHPRNFCFSNFVFEIFRVIEIKNHLLVEEQRIPLGGDSEK
jgi:hypothetical protein